MVPSTTRFPTSVTYHHPFPAYGPNSSHATCTTLCSKQKPMVTWTIVIAGIGGAFLTIQSAMNAMLNRQANNSTAFASSVSFLVGTIPLMIYWLAQTKGESPTIEALAGCKHIKQCLTKFSLELRCKMDAKTVCIFVPVQHDGGNTLGDS